MGNGRGLSRSGLSGSGLPGARLEGRLKWICVVSAAIVLLLIAGVMLNSGSRRYAQSAGPASSAFPIPAAFGKAALKSKPDARGLLGQLPLIFEPNQGQTDSRVKFVSHGAGYSLFLDSTGAVLAMQTAQPASAGQRVTKLGTARSVEAVRMTLVGANPEAAVAGSDRLPGISNYFIGNDPKKWHTGIPQFAGVRYQSVYPGIDLVFYGSQGHLEYDFKVAPGADPSQAELQFDGAAKLVLSGGDLILKGTGADVRLQAPRVYQTAAGHQQAVEGRFVLRAANRVGFEIGFYDRSRELVIDPTIAYSTYFGGTGNETYPSIAVNNDGVIYLAGSTTSPNLLTMYPSPIAPIQSTLNATAGAQNIFLLKLDPTAGPAGVLYLTYLGGSGIDSSAGLGVDAGGTAYVAGTTTSTNFPTSAGAFQTVPDAGSTCAPLIATETVPCHVFVSAVSGLDTAGAVPALLYSTYLSGNGSEIASGLAIDNNADVFVTGTTTSTNSDTGFPSTLFPPAYQQTSLGAIQFFVTKVNTKTNGLDSISYSTYFGGSNGTIDTGGGIAVDTTGNIYFSGTTNIFNSGEATNGSGGLAQGDFPILNAYQPCLDTPPPTVITFPVTCTQPASPVPTDAFVAKINPANAQTGASQLLFSTYFGGSGTDSSTGLTIDPTAAAIYITGSTNTMANVPSITTGTFVIPTGTAPFQECLDTPVNPTTPVCPAIAAPAPTDAYVAKFTNPTEASGATSNAVGLSYFSYLGGTGERQWLGHCRGYGRRCAGDRSDQFRDGAG